MIVNPEFQELIPRLSEEEYKGLEESIKKEGCRDAIIVWRGRIIDGHNRYKICKENNIKFNTIENTNLKNENEAKIWIINNQFSRRNIDPYTRGELALELEKLLLGRQGRKEKGANVGTFKGKTRDIIAKSARLGHGTIDKIKLIKEKATPETKQKIKESKISINKAYKDIRREEKKREFVSKNVSLPEGKFNVIYADPPWKYEHSETKSRDIENNYPTMSLEDIKNMEIPSDKDSVLFLWATAPKLKEALEVMQSWGFTYRTNAVWDKETIGMGYWFRGQHELLLVGVRGNMSPPFPENRFSSVYREKKKEHSKKPEYYYEIIERMFPKGKYLELFSRNKRKNWTMWGDQ